MLAAAAVLVFVAVVVILLAAWVIEMRHDLRWLRPHTPANPDQTNQAHPDQAATNPTEPDPTDQTDPDQPEEAPASTQ